MRLFLGLVAVALLTVPGVNAAAPRQSSQSDTQPSKSIPTPPAWAYALNPPNVPPVKDDGSPHTLPGSTKALTRQQTLDGFNVADWRPEDHPAMPEVVEHGRKPEVRGCAYCHLPNGLGRPENASLAGLPADYIIEQVAEFKAGARKSAEPKLGPPTAMIGIAKAVSDEDLKTAAEYFASLKLKPWIKVVETDTVPKTRVAGTMLIPVEGGGTEPIGNRIIETPQDVYRTELRDAGSGFIAYVPVGSLKKGEELVTTGGGGKTVRCAICHGPELHGLGPVPPIAGRSPSYIFRQLFDIQHGVRAGSWTALMKEPLARLSEDDLVSISAYLASRMP
jgi:cytochrome c553